jgi:hypothetical protein
MILAGGYAIWYGRWELAVYDGALGTDPIIDTMEDIRLWFVDTTERIGAQRLTILVALAVAAVITAAKLTRTPKRTTEPAIPITDANTAADQHEESPA